MAVAGVNVGTSGADGLVLALLQSHLALLLEYKLTTITQKMIIVPGLGGWQKFVYVFFGVIPYGGKKHINKIPPQNPGTIP